MSQGTGVHDFDCTVSSCFTISATTSFNAARAASVHAKHLEYDICKDWNVEGM